MQAPKSQTAYCMAGEKINLFIRQLKPLEIVSGVNMGTVNYFQNISVNPKLLHGAWIAENSLLNEGWSLRSSEFKYAEQLLKIKIMIQIKIYKILCYDIYYDAKLRIMIKTKLHNLLKSFLRM